MWAYVLCTAAGVVIGAAALWLAAVLQHEHPEQPTRRLWLRVVNQDDGVLAGPLSPETLALLLRYGGFQACRPRPGTNDDEGWTDLRAVLGLTPDATVPGRFGGAVGDLRLQLRVEDAR